ncbi:MAG TPA: hypothetical protein DCP28_38100, partial [Cytophagales bacterium]|nr:hypothetical protein [Cytophagales bacterium]
PQAGESISYSALPIYTKATGEDQTDPDHTATSTTVNTPDFLTSVAASVDNQGITLTWDATQLPPSYDTLQLERDGALLAYVPASEGAYEDTLMLFGDTYTYTATVIEKGAPALS